MTSVFPVVTRSLVVAAGRRLQVAFVLLGMTSFLVSLCLLRTSVVFSNRDDRARTAARTFDSRDDDTSGDIDELRFRLRCKAARSDATVEQPIQRPGRNGFVSNAPKQLIIVTYQRSGSTFYGNIFSRNLRDVFYTFEPIDSFYSAMYGTLPGWNVPSDITAFEDGTERSLPEAESQSVVRFLRSLLTCDVDQLPTETLVHRFWTEWSVELPRLVNYASCLKNLTERAPPTGNGRKPTNTGSESVPFGNVCFRYTVAYCGDRFAAKPPERHAECHQLLTNASFRSAHPDPEVRQNFTRYVRCTASQRSRLIERGCLRQLRESCLSSRVRVTKVVRLPMSILNRLLEALPDLRVVHLVRDPRAVVLSRLHFDDSGRSQLTKRVAQWLLKVASESTFVCNQIAADFRYRERLLDAYGERRIVTVRYEDVVSSPLNYTKLAYNLIDMPVPCHVFETMLALVRRGNRNSSAVRLAEGWKTGLNVEARNIVSSVCSDVLRLLYHDSDVPPSAIPADTQNLLSILNSLGTNDTSKVKVEVHQEFTDHFETRSTRRSNG